MGMKKVLAALLSTTMVAGMLAGCGTGAAPAPAATEAAPAATEAAAPEATEAAPATEAASGEVQEITWMVWDDLEATEDLISKGYKETIDRYNKDYEGKYHVNVVSTNLEDYYTKLNALVAANETPDVFIVSPGANLTDYVTPGVVAPLDDYLAQDGWKDQFVAGAFDKATYDGKAYAVPLNLASACVFYNTEMFEKAGATVPTTYDELLDTCEKLKAAGFTPITISAGTPWCLSMLAGYLCQREGADLDAINAGTGSWLDKPFVDAVGKMVELSKYFQPTAAGDDNDVATSGLYNGEAAMLIQGSWAIGQINGENPDFEDKCGVFQFPAIEGGGDGGMIIAKSDSLAMSSTTKYPEASIALMKYFVDETAQKYTGEVGGKIPVIASTELDYEKAPKQLKYVMDIMDKSTGMFGFYNESLATPEAGSTFDDAMVSVYLGDSTPEEGLQKVEDFFKDEIWN